MPSKKQLEAAAATAGMFEKAPAKQPRQQEKPKVDTPNPERKRETVTFSVKIDSDVLRRWRIYASIDGYGDKGKLTEAALTEYMSKHKLSPEQQARFDRYYEIEV